MLQASADEISNLKVSLEKSSTEYQTVMKEMERVKQDFSKLAADKQLVC